MGGSHRMLDKHYVLYEDVIPCTHDPESAGAHRPGQRLEGFTCHTLDLAPTLLEWMGAEIPDTLQGQSLWPMIAGEANRSGIM